MFKIKQLSENKPLNRFIKKTQWLCTVVTSRWWRYLCDCCCSVPSVCGYSTLNASIMVWLNNPNCYIPNWLPRSSSHRWKIYSIFGILLIILRISKYQSVFVCMCVSYFQRKHFQTVLRNSAWEREPIHWKTQNIIFIPDIHHT